MNLALVVDDKKERREASKEKWANSPEGKAYQKKWREENREHYKEKMREWNKKNHDKLLAQQRELRKLPHIAKQRADYQKKYLAEIPLLGRVKRIINNARFNSRKKGLEFSITIDDVVWNDVCPVLGIKLNYGAPTNGKLSYDTPSIDRTDPTKGYVKGNVVIMSWRANMLKRDATCEEANQLANYFNRLRS